MAALLAAGADLDARAANDYGETPLHKTIVWDGFLARQWLIPHGADISVSNAVGMTPLEVAASGGAFGCAHVLLDAGADPNQVGAVGDNGLVYAVVSETSTANRLRMVQLLIDHGAAPAEAKHRYPVCSPP